MDLEKIMAELKADPAKLSKLAEAVKGGDIEKALKEHGIDIEPEKIAELGKRIAAEGGDLLEKGQELLKGDGARELLEKGSELLGGLFGGKK